MPISRWAAHWARLRAEGRDLIELVLLPGLAAVLPWRWALALFRRLAAWPWLYREACTRALREAQAFGVVDDAGRWLRERRLVTLVDHADYYLARTRGNAWLRRHVHVHGAWPAGGPALFVTFHWGCGMWALRHLGASGMGVHALAAHPDGIVGRTVLRRYAAARLRAVEAALGRATIEVPGSMRELLRAWAAREPVLAVIDAPADQMAATARVTLLGRPARVASALVRAALKREVPIVLYTLSLDPASGERELRVLPLGPVDDAQAALEQLFAHLEALLRERPAAWHLWSEAARVFVAPESPAAHGGRADHTVSGAPPKRA